MSIRSLCVALVGAAFVAGCGGGDAGQETGEMEQSSGGEVMSAPASEPAPEGPQPQTIGELFPEGEGRIMVLNNCASCHAVACSAIGQRSQSRWNAIQSAHADRLPGLSEADMETLFGYLSSHFNDTLPEPNVPQAFLARGCTPN